MHKSFPIIEKAEAILVQAFTLKLSEIHPLSQDLIEEFQAHGYQQKLQKNEYLIKRGEYSKSIYFIVKGILTGQAGSSRHKITSFIAVEGDFLSAIEGMHGAEACEEDIVAQEDCLLLGISVENINRFYDNYPEMNIIMRKILERYYKKAHKRSVFFRIGMAAEKYQYFCETYPVFIERIPIAIIASFLNIKLSTLQKIVASANQLDKARAQNTSLSKEQIIQFITEQKPFRQKKMTLAEVARQLEVSPHELSRLLNQYFLKNFNQFLNDYRIAHALKMMLEHNNIEQFSLEGIGNDAGFGSRSTFFAEFKKRAGQSPTDYMKSKKNQPAKE